MKLRIYRNSLRFRLTPDDVATLDETGAVHETTDFGQGATFSYTLRTRADLEQMRARLEPLGVCVELPAAAVHEWNHSDTVGLEHRQPLGDCGELDILIEKDFECLEGKMNEPGVRLYPNPNENCL